MTRYLHLRWLAPIAGLVAAGVIALSAAPSGATIVCPQGVKPPSPYCTNVPPTATTGNATNVKGNKRDVERRRWAKRHGRRHHPVLLQVRDDEVLRLSDAAPARSARARPESRPRARTATSPRPRRCRRTSRGWRPARRTTSSWSRPTRTASAKGGDKTFTTKFAHPLKKVKAPNKVKAGHKFQVQFTLSDDAKVKIVIKKKKGGAVVTYNYGTLRSGKHSKKITAPRTEGRLRPRGDRQAELRLADRDEPAEGQLTPSSEGRAKSRPSVSPEPTPAY